MKKWLAILLSVFLLATMIPLSAVSVSAEQPTDAGWVWPVDGAIFSRGFENGHSGIDIAAGKGVAVKAVNSGTVLCASKATTAANGYCSNCCRYGAGYHVTIVHPNGLIGMYAHLSDVCVYSGQEVVAGQQVGKVGNTGNSKGDHLHFSLFANNYISDANLVDPLHYLTPFSSVYATDVTETGATIYGVFGAYGPTVTQAGIYIGTDPSNMYKVTETLNTEGYDANGNAIQAVFYGTQKWYGTLKQGTTYYYKVWITRYGKEYTSAVRSFTTKGDHTHVWGDWSVVKAATCGADGEQVRTCGCGASETQTIPATGAHIYADDYDADCNICGTVRQVPDKPVTPVFPAFVVDNATAREGEEFTVAIRTENNSGIVSLKLKVGYDADRLELVSVTEQDFANLSFGSFEKNPFIINWVDAIHPDNTTDGVVALVTFRVKEGAQGTAAITLTYDAEDVYDQNYDNVTFRIENGTVEIVEYTPGDVNDDGRINNKDLGMLQQYVNEWEVSLNEAAADCNGDGRVNNKDLGLLQQYVNEWDVELG